MSFVRKAIKSFRRVELLGITLDENVNFKSHMKILLQSKYQHKSSFPNLEFSYTRRSKNFLAEAYISSTFRYCLLIWMFCGKCTNNLIMRTHYRCLQAIYDTQTMIYRDLLHINVRSMFTHRTSD